MSDLKLAFTDDIVHTENKQQRISETERKGP